MANTQVNPTRMELTRLKKKLSTAMRGHKLLKDKRDELMRQFLDMVRQNKALREKVESGIHAANKNFLLARAATDAQVLDVALMAPKQEVFLEASERNVMSVEIPVFEYKTRTADSNDIIPTVLPSLLPIWMMRYFPYLRFFLICSSWRRLKNPAS